MRRAAVNAVLVVLAVALQLTFVDRLPLPGGSVPDIALLIVVALGLMQGPAAGMLAGFFAGLGLDLTPPASHLLGESALVLCLVGYGCGRLSGWLNRSAPPRLLAAGVVGAVIGETLQTTIGMIVSDPGVTLPAVRHVLPVAVVYDVLLSPVVLALVSVASRQPGARTPGGAGRDERGLGSAPAAKPARPVSLRLGALSRGGRPASFRPGGTRGGPPHPRAFGPGGSRNMRRPRIRPDGGGAVRSGPRQGLPARPVRLRLGASRARGLRLRRGRAWRPGGLR
jgi:rod shape-determining protein MreD